MPPLLDPKELVVGVVRAEFADTKGFYYPGEKIVGQLFIRLDKVIKCRALVCVFKGEGKAQWETSSGNDSVPVLKTNNEILFHHAETLLKPPQRPGESMIIINPGEIFHPFEFQLPNDLPPSACSSNFGSRAMGDVMYSVQVVFVSNKGKLESATNIQAWPPINFKIKARPLNLDNIRGDLLQPLTDTKEKYLCCLCCQSGPIRVNVTIQKRLYHPGEQIVFSVEVDNKETNKTLGIHAVLLAWYTIFGKSGKKKRSHPKEVADLLLTGSMLERSHEIWKDVTLNIPEDTTTSFQNCKCVHLEYKFTVNVHISSAYSFDTKVSLPIVIANGLQNAQPVGQSRGTSCEEMPVHLTDAASHFLPTAHLPPIGHPQPASYPLKTITQQPSQLKHP